MKVCSNGPGHMTKMATTSIYGKNPIKIFVFETNGPITFDLGLSYSGYCAYKVCSKDDPRLILTL